MPLNRDDVECNRAISVILLHYFAFYQCARQRCERISCAGNLSTSACLGRDKNVSQRMITHSHHIPPQAEPSDLMNISGWSLTWLTAKFHLSLSVSYECEPCERTKFQNSDQKVLLKHCPNARAYE
jgi:hypothetical protein